MKDSCCFLPSQLVEPVSPHGSEEVRVGQHHCAESRVHRPAVDALSGPHMTDLRPGAPQDGREVDEVLAEEEGATDHQNQHRRDHPPDAEPRHVFVIRIVGCPDLAHW